MLLIGWVGLVTNLLGTTHIIFVSISTTASCISVISATAASTSSCRGRYLEQREGNEDVVDTKVLELGQVVAGEARLCAGALKQENPHDWILCYPSEYISYVIWTSEQQYPPIFEKLEEYN